MLTLEDAETVQISNIENYAIRHCWIRSIKPKAEAGTTLLPKPYWMGFAKGL